MIIYSGLGFLVLVFGGVGLFASIWADDTYKIGDPASMYLCLSVWALLCAFVGIWVNSGRRDKVLIDPDTNEEVHIGNRHSLLFINIEYWAFIILAFGAYSFYQDFSSGKIDLKALSAVLTKQSEHTDSTSADFRNGYEAFTNRNYPEALASFSKAADRGQPEAQYYLGILYRDGLGVKQDDQKTLMWFQKAADQGDLKAQANIGFIYANGLGVTPDLNKAAFWYRKSADGGYSVAQYLLGMMYLEGKGIEKDTSEAAKWLGKAALQGDEDAKKALVGLQPSPTINPPARQTSSRSYVPGRINIVFSDAIPREYTNGRAQSCTLVANIHNNTKYRLNKVSFKIEDWQVAIDEELNANSYVDGYPLLKISLANNTVCAFQAEFIRQSIKKASVFDCSIPGMAEGDCQDLVAISTWIDETAVKRINDADVALGAKQVGPVRDALAKAGFVKGNGGPITPDRVAKFAVLLDTLVAIDSQSWSWNQYVRGSMTSVSVIGQSQDGGTITLRGSYKYLYNDKGASGWVAAKIENGSLSCLLYHDFQNDCRAIRLPDVGAAQ